MSAYDKWEIAGVLPEDYEDFGAWVLQKGSAVLKNVGSGVVYHKHSRTPKGKSNPTLMLIMVGPNGHCRECDAIAPLGLIFRARTVKLDTV